MDKGLIHIYTGKGKGKTTAAMGLVLRALGYDKKIYINQFLKGRETGEKIFLEKLPQVTFKRSGETSRFYFNMTQKEKDEVNANIKKSWDRIVKAGKSSKFDIMVLDEILPVVTRGIIAVEAMVELMQNKSQTTELVLTGRNAPKKLKEKADYVTEMKMIKHPFSRNIKARKGIEY
ncbi:MAG: cob(I)yrinic acid a,c-diamide adenosyltransferase [Bacillota bacterium]